MRFDSIIFVSKMRPPVGGVSVFAERKVDEMRGAGVDVDVVNLNQKLWPLVIISKAIQRSKLKWIVNTVNPMVLLLLYCMGRLRKTTVYDHNASRRYIKRKFPLGPLWRFLISRVWKVVVVQERLVDSYKGVNGYVSVESPFIAPDLKKEQDARAQWPEWFWDFICDAREQVVLNSAWQYVFDENGRDIYGVKETVRVLGELVGEGVPAKLVLNFGLAPSDEDIRSWEGYRALRAKNSILIISGQRELWPVFRKIDLYLRTTSTDGDSIGVREALYFGCPVVASNAVPRPYGVKLYSFGDSVSLKAAILRVLDRL